MLRLRNHIPIGSPARREPCDGTEPPLRVSPGFEPEWYHHRSGADFSQRWHEDPHYRWESRRGMKAELERAFPGCDYWSAVADADLASLSGCYGITVIPRMFGFGARYHAHRWPEVEPGRLLTDDETAALDPDRILASPFVEHLFRQMDEIRAGWGSVRGYLNWQGVLNIAFHLRGQQVFLDMAENQGLAEHLFAVITEVLVRMVTLVQARQRESGFDVNQFCVSNCTVSMVSPRMYARYLLPHDRRIAQSFERFGVHTCNWDVTPYLKVLGELPNMGYLDMGFMSDLAAARKTFPETRLAVLYSPRNLVEYSREEIERDMRRVRRELAPCDVVLADLPLDAPDERVNELLEICRDLGQQTE